MMGCGSAILCLALAAGGAADEGHDGPRPVIVCSATHLADFALQVVGDRWEVRTSPEAATGGEGKLFLRDELGLEPDAWLVPRHAAAYVNHIVRAVVERDPDAKAEYHARARLFLMQLRAADGWVRRQLGALPEGKRALLEPGPLWNVFASEYGLGQTDGSGVGRSVSLPKARGRDSAYLQLLRDKVIDMVLTDLPRPERKPSLICSTTQVADFAMQVVGDRGVIRCILAPGADPHTYVPTPEAARLVREADLALQNGLHLEGKNWMGTLAKDANRPLVTCADGVPPLEMDYDGRKVEDPHAWFSTTNAAIYVRNVVRAVTRLDPGGGPAYRARGAFYLARLEALDGWARGQFHAIPVSERKLITSHDAFQYFCNDYAMVNRAPVGWSTGSEVGGGMTPKRQKMVVDSIKNFGVKAVFVETSVNPKLIRQIARNAGVRIGGELYSDSMGEAVSLGEAYLGMMRENVLTIVGALR